MAARLKNVAVIQRKRFSVQNTADTEKLHNAVCPRQDVRSFAHFLPARIQSTLLLHRRQQHSGFKLGRCICDSEQAPTGLWSFQVHCLRADFDSLSRPALWLLLTRFDVPNKKVGLTKALCAESVSRVHAVGLQSSWFELRSGWCSPMWLLQTPMPPACTSCQKGQLQ